MNKYKISLIGCDDETVFEMELTDSELELVNKICAKSKEESTYSCMPKMEVEVSTQPKEG